MQLYHISFDGKETIKFKPRVPSIKAVDEDNVTKRVCFSESIAGALSAIPDLCERMGDFNTDMMVYTLDTSRISPKYLISSRELYDMGLVLDAFATREWWLTKEISLIGRRAKLFSNCFERTNYLITQESNRERVYDVISKVVKRNNIHNELFSREDCDKYTLAYICNKYAMRFDSNDCYVSEEVEDELLDFCENLRIIYNLSYMYYDDMVKVNESIMPLEDELFMYRTKL